MYVHTLSCLGTNEGVLNTDQQASVDTNNSDRRPREFSQMERDAPP